MRAYFWGNMYLSSIQQGIQAAHVIQEMNNKYKEIDLYDYGLSTGENPSEHMIRSANRYKVLNEWGRNHKTIILLNGGYSCNLIDIHLQLNVPENPYPVAYFQEGANELNSAVTSVGIVLPEKIYKTAESRRKNVSQYPAFILTQFESGVVDLINASSLAR